jgi:hypothetical protein
LVIGDAAHDDFETRGDPLGHPRIWWPTLAWFDRWVAGDPTALARLAAPTWNGTPRSDALSAHFTSMVATPDYDCPDLDVC